MFAILLLLFTVIPALEFYLLFHIGAQIGAFYTLLIIITTGIVGAGLAKHQGLSILKEVNQQLSKGKVPGQEIIHGFLVFGGGLLLLTPGFLTDFFGLTMVIPGTRHLICKFIIKYFSKSIQSGRFKFSGFSNFSSTSFSSSSHFRQDKPSSLDDSIEAEFKVNPSEKK